MSEKKGSQDDVPTGGLPLEGPRGSFDVEEATDSLFNLLSDSGKDVGAFDVNEDEEGNRAEETDEQSEDKDDSDNRRDDEEEEEEEERAEESDDDERDEEDESETDDESVVTYKVKVDGEEVEVTQDELLRGYSRTQDYTRKTQALAEERRAFQSERESVVQERATYADRLTVLEEAIKATQPPEPDWDKLRQSDPVRYAAEVADHTRRKEALAAIAEERSRVEYQQSLESQRTYAEHLQAERARLIEAIPEWADEAKAREEKDSLADYAKSSYGYTDQDLDAVTDHRIMVILRKAAAYDRLQEGQSKLAEKKVKAKVLKPGATPKKSKGKDKPTSRSARARQRLSETGSVDDAADALYDLIGDD